MNANRAILVPLDGSRTAARSLGCATWLATRLGARLHILSATDRPLPARAELERLHVAEEHWPLIDLHQATGRHDRAILAAVAAHGIGLLVMTALGATAEATRGAGASGPPPPLLGHVTRSVLERCAVPVVLIPPAYGEDLPWRTLVVPVGRERSRDEALALAARLGQALDVPVHVVHVADSSVSRGHVAGGGHYNDAAHHEYAARLDDLVDRVLPSVPVGERERIQGTHLYRGDVVHELAALAQSPGSVLVIQWSGHFEQGRATILKALLPTVRCPVLLVRSPPPSPLHLKVGEAFG